MKPTNVYNMIKKYPPPTKRHLVALYCSKITAGFPSPADDYIDKNLDLNEHLIKKPAATFFLRASGDSMQEKGIFNNDMLIVDKSIKPQSGDVVIASIDGQFTVKTIYLDRNKKIFLMPANKNYSPIEITQTAELLIWGVVVHVIHTLKG
jgi:DNA polymerase V